MCWAAGPGRELTVYSIYPLTRFFGEDMEKGTEGEGMEKGRDDGWEGGEGKRAERRRKKDGVSPVFAKDLRP